jgi:hypothetical protein
MTQVADEGRNSTVRPVPGAGEWLTESTQGERSCGRAVKSLGEIAAQNGAKQGYGCEDREGDGGAA